MFTGIIEELGTIKSLDKKSQAVVLSVKADKVLSDVKKGDSIAINGVCLTVTNISGNILKFDVSGETLEKSNIGSLKPDEKVNLENALKADSRLGGHFVTGHIDCTSAIRKTRKPGDNLIMEIAMPRQFIRYVVPKGSIAVDGISLTVGDVFDDYFIVHIIPYTFANTTLSFKKQGDYVNIETDVLAKYVNRTHSSKEKSDITTDFLSNHGFM